MKKLIALLVVAGLSSFAFAADANTSAPKAKADKNASKHKASKKEANASK